MITVKEQVIKLLISDLHTHTKYSFDSVTDPEELIQQAISKGVGQVAITDHADVDFEDSGIPLDLKSHERKEEIIALKKKYRNRIRVIYGIELGQPDNNRALADSIIKENGYEYVLGSIHNLKNAPDFYFIDFKKALDYPEMIDNMYNRYLNDLISLSEIPYIDCITHVTYIVRYIQAAGGDINISRYYYKYAELFSKMASSGKALEINTSNLRRGFGSTMPSEDLLRLYSDVGGRLVTVGSDAHRPHEVGADLAEGYALAKKYGLTPITDINELY